ERRRQCVHPLYRRRSRRLSCRRRRAPERRSQRDAMSVAETIRDKLTERFAPTRLDIVDESHRHAGHAGARPEGETHFAVTITSATFGGLGGVASQRLVYEAVKEELACRVHGVSLTTLLPEEDRS